MVEPLDSSYCFINVYMPYQHDDNYGTFMECIGKLSAAIADSDMCNFIILSDFNSAVDTQCPIAMRITVLLGSTTSSVVMMLILKFHQLIYWTN